MGRPPRKDCDDKVALNRRYLRVQYLGMGIFLAWPVAIQFAGYFGLNIRFDVLTVLMVLVAAIIFAIGTDGRDKLKESNRQQ